MKEDEMTLTGGLAHEVAMQGLSTELGLPAGAHTATVRMHGGKYGPSWKDYRIEIFGQFLDEKVRRRDGHFFMRWGDPKDVAHFEFEGWQLQLRIEKVKPYLEIRYYPEFTIVIRNIDRTTSQSHVRRLLKGRELVMRVEQSDYGRPVGSGIFEDETEFSRRVKTAFIHCENEDERPTLDRIAAFVGVSVTTLKDYKKKWPHAWPRKL